MWHSAAYCGVLRKYVPYTSQQPGRFSLKILPLLLVYPGPT